MVKLYVFLLTFILLCYPSTAAAEDRVQIAVLDTGVNITDSVYPFLCSGGHTDLTGTSTADVVGHGNMVLDIVIQGLDPEKYCVRVIKWYHNKTTKGAGRLAKAINLAVEQGANLINISAEGSLPSKDEAQAIKAAIIKGIHVVIASGNKGQDLSALCDVYPACYPYKNKYFHVVADYLSGKRSPYSNFGGPVTIVEDGRYTFGGHQWLGTSVSTAKVTNKLAKLFGAVDKYVYLKNRK